MDPNIKQSIVDRLKQTNNVLVTVKKDPNVDQLSACIGLTLFLNKLGKHATAVFSGEVPSTIEFLKPDKTLEKDTNSLRDFIISLDKSKADKLRYKVEDQVVRIFITPYRTSLSEADLDFSQGDFNVDVVMAIGVHVREELDQAIMAHGRILHDATVISINNTKPADLGALNWNDPKASSLSEMIASLADLLQPNQLDSQMATAFLTGIVAETQRFSNTKTTPATMSISSKLMTAGANQQLVATKLEEPVKVEQPKEDDKKEKKKDDGALEIDHPKAEQKEESTSTELPLPADDGAVGKEGEIHIDEQGNFKTGLQDQPNDDDKKEKSGRLTLEPPTLGSALTANTEANHLDPSVDPLSGRSPNDAIITRDKPAVMPSSDTVSSKGVDIKPTTSQTLSSIEEQVGSPHATLSNLSSNPNIDQSSIPNPSETTLSNEELKSQNMVDSSVQGNVSEVEPPKIQSLNEQPVDDINPIDNLETARLAVEEASSSSELKPNPLQSVGAQFLDDNIHSSESNITQTTTDPAQIQNNYPGFVPQSNDLPPEQSGTDQPPTPPPPVPPPMMPPMS